MRDCGSGRRRSSNFTSTSPSSHTHVTPSPVVKITLHTQDEDSGRGIMDSNKDSGTVIMCTDTRLVAREAHFSKSYQVPLSRRLGTMRRLHILCQFRIFREYFGLGTLAESACKTFFAKSSLGVTHKFFFCVRNESFWYVAVAMSYRALKTAGTGCFGKKVNVTIFSAKEEKFSEQNCVNDH